MDKLSSILDSVKERLANPFIFSFIVAWLTYNWPITIGFVWYDSDKVNMVQLIRETATGCLNFLIPLGGAIFYTFIVPFLSIGLRMFNANIIKWGNNRVFKISKQSKVSFEHYFEIMQENTEKGKQLDEMIDNQKSLREQRNEATRKVVDLETMVKEKESEVEKLKTEQTKTDDRYVQQLAESAKQFKDDNQKELNKFSFESALKYAGLQDTMDKERNKQNQIHDASVIYGNWDIEKTELTVFISDRKFIVNGEADDINLFDNSNRFLHRKNF